MGLGPDLENARDRIVASLVPQVSNCVGYWLLMLERVCESPIEIALGAAILTADQLEHENVRPGLTLSGVREVGDYPKQIALLIPQMPWEGYRIDFAIRLPRYRFGYLFIECDGHDFHERTKQQAARDRQKDRLIQQAGIPILRFTGAEIYRSAGDCAAQVIRFIEERYDDYLPRG